MSIKEIVESLPVTIMATAPNPREIATLVSDLLKRGDQEKVADALNVKPCDLSRRLNPTDERRLGLFEGLRELWAIAGVNPDAFHALRVYIENLFSSWEAPSKPASLASLVIAAHKEGGEVIESWAAGKPIHEQRKETVEAIAALQRHLEGLDRQSALREAGTR